MKRGAAFGVAWIATVALAAFAGWLASQRFWPPPGDRAVADAQPLPGQGTIEDPVLLPRGFQLPPGTPTGAPAEPAVEPEPEPVLEQPEPTPEPPPLAPPAEPEPDIAATPEPVVDIPVVEPVEPEPAIVITEGYERADALAASGDFEAARTEAEALLAEFGDYSGLIAAFEKSGADETRARLDALRVLQLGGLQMISVELARELKRSYAGSTEVLQAIHDWRILKPNVTTIESSIVEGRGVLVQGHVANPDVGAVRRVFVEVEALDAGGNTVATATTRVRPRSLGSGEAGSFSAELTDIDPASVLRVRATVVKWESEVFEQLTDSR